jgi:putative ABC transport system permease protein
VLIFLFLHHHLNFDRHHTKAERIARVLMDVNTDTKLPFPGAPYPMAQALRDECAFVEKAALRYMPDETLITVLDDGGDNVKFKEKESAFAWVEPDYFQILDLPLLRGRVSDLREPNTVLLTERIARKYFGEQDPMGSMIRLANRNDLRVVGILQDLPLDTDYPHEIYGSWATLNQVPNESRLLDSWGSAQGEGYCLALLKPGYELADLNKVLMKFRKTHAHPEAKDLFHYKALPFLDMHFDTDYGFGMNKAYLWALALIALFLLITACVNFVNMATALAQTRVREVGVRKSLGSTKGHRTGRLGFWLCFCLVCLAIDE